MGLASRVSFCFFFQAEDGIRDWSVTGVQTCALPICASGNARHNASMRRVNSSFGTTSASQSEGPISRVGCEVSTAFLDQLAIAASAAFRSEERRVGKEWRERGARYEGKKSSSEVMLR